MAFASGALSVSEVQPALRKKAQFRQQAPDEDFRPRSTAMPGGSTL